MSLSAPTTPSQPQTSLSGFPKARKSASEIVYNGCRSTWTGGSACHCTGCHATFTGITAFDIHRVGGVCNPPASLLTKDGQPRLVAVTRPHWSGWGMPGEKPIPSAVD